MEKNKNQEDKNIDYLLSDNFIEFSKAIEQLYLDKKKKKEHLKQVYEKIQLEIKEIDNKAKKINSDFENWKLSLEQDENIN